MTAALLTAATLAAVAVVVILGIGWLDDYAREHKGGRRGC